jgi:hypothetical protein
MHANDTQELAQGIFQQATDWAQATKDMFA